MIDWDIITETIAEQKCILFIGPEVLSGADGKPLNTMLREYLNIDDNPSIQKYYEDVELFLFKNGTEKTRTYYKIKKFYNQQFERAEALFAKIAEIPFHLIISINPDEKLPDAYRKLGRKFKFDFYWKNKTGDQAKRLAGGNIPVIYNMLGHIGEQESMILSYDDLFDYFNSIANDVIPADIRLTVKDASNLIFLGFDFEKWYMQLLLRFLYTKQDQYRFMQYASNSIMQERTRSFCVDQFQIEFVPNNVYEFVEQLYDKCREEGLLKAAEEDVIQQTIALVEKNKLEEALQMMKTFLSQIDEKGEELREQISLLISRQQEIKKREILGMIEEENLLINTARIKAEFMELIAKAKELE